MNNYKGQENVDDSDRLRPEGTRKQKKILKKIHDLLTLSNY